MRYISIAIAIVISTFTASEARANLILNGSFELPEIGPATFVVFDSVPQEIPNWTITQGDVDINSNNVLGSNLVAQDGDQWIDLNGFNRGIIAQFFNTVVGQKYQLEFYYSDNPFNNGNGSQQGVEKTGNFSIRNSANVLLIPLGEFSHSTATVSGGADWTYSGPVLFTATSTQTRLAFSGDLNSGSTGPFLDNVSVIQAPEPVTLQLLGIALGGLFWRRLRRGPRTSQ